MDQTLYIGDIYEEKGATIPDGWVLYISGFVDTSTAGVYEITYFARNPETNQNVTRIKTVEVLDPKPVITITGDDNIFIDVGSEYGDAGATTDKGTLETIIPSGGVRTDKAGSYCILYVATHKGSLSFASRTVHVVGASSQIVPPAAGIDIDNISINAPAAGLDIDTISVNAPAAGLDIDNINISINAPAVGIDIDNVTINAPAAGLDIDNIAINAPDAGLDIDNINISINAPAAGLDIDNVSVPAPAAGLDIQDASVPVPNQGPIQLTAEELVDAPAAGLDISSAVEFLEADTLTMVGEWIKPAYSPYNRSNAATPGGYERSGITRAGAPKIPKRFSEFLYGYPEARYIGGATSYISTDQYTDYTWKLDEAALQNGIVRYTRQVPQNWPTGTSWMFRETRTSDVMHDPNTGLDYFDGLFARYYLDGFWYADTTVVGDGPAQDSVDFISRPTTKEEQPGGNWSNDLSIYNPSVYSSEDYKFAVLAAGGSNTVSSTVSYYVSAPSDYAPGYTSRSTSTLTPVSNGMQLSTMSVGSNTNKWPNVIWEYVEDTALVGDYTAALGWPFINSTSTLVERTYRHYFITQWQYDSYANGVVKYVPSAIPQWAQNLDPSEAHMRYSSEYGTVVFEGLQVHTLSSWNNSDFKTHIYRYGDTTNAYDGYLPSSYHYSNDPTTLNDLNLPERAELSHMSYHTDPITYINGAKGLLVTRDTDLVNSQ